MYSPLRNSFTVQRIRLFYTRSKPGLVYRVDLGSIDCSIAEPS